MKTPHETTLLEEVLADWTAPETAATPSAACGLLAEVIDDRHPSLLGRVRVQRDAEATWLPCLSGLTPRVGDRVLVLRPEGCSEPVVVGVLDGHEERPRPSLRGPSLELRRDEALTVVGHRGRPLLQVRQGTSGPVVRLLQSDVGVEVDGRLELSAHAIELHATRGEARIEAAGDVVVRGELIHLN